MSAPRIISELVERFKFNIQDYKQGNYNETQVRREFIDPFFKELGWDISNEKGYAEAYKDVVHEYSLKTKDKAEAPDYLFRIGGTKKFFVEAKKPSVNLREDISPAFQLRRYAWSAKLPLSILTDFEELVIYDCRIQPKKTDKSSTGRIKYFTYEEYIDKWDEIESIFSREAVLKGSFDKYAESNKGKRGTAEVDDAFLKEIENWREILARNIALRNENLTNRELNFSVQKTIDRIIFLRICEDRGIEDYGQLMALQNGVNVYQRLLQIFTRADEKYNSGLFHFEDEKNRTEEPDKITPAIVIDDKVLKEIIKNLYYPDSPYEFSVLPSDILGHVYEQFLGKVIRLTAGHRAVVEEKPEVKKAGGVYYTPTYIVDYIVKNTLGKKLEEIEEKFSLTNGHSGLDQESQPKINRAIKEASKLKVLDPACGSGSFLIGAYQYLLDWHIKLYSVEISFMKSPGAETSLMKSLQKTIYQTKEGEYRLTTTEKKRILLNNIYGVDIDSQAVEVTKLSLLLKVLEGETDESLFTQISLFRQRALPDLSSNIKCGNSLIGPDFYDQTELDLDEEEHYRINVFNWDDEFKEIMSDGGFDCVIGNPPYGKTISKIEQSYFKSNYRHQDYQLDLYLLFLERYSKILEENGFLGVIVSNTWLQSLQLKSIRQYLVNEFSWLNLLIPKNKVFKAVVDTHVLIFSKDKNKSSRASINTLDNQSVTFSHFMEQKLIPADGSAININCTQEQLHIKEKILKNTIPLMKITNVYNGIKPFEKGKGKPPQTKEIVEEKPYVTSGLQQNEEWSPLLRGSLISRYKISWNENYWIKYGEWLAAPRDSRIFEDGDKIFVRQTGDSLISAYSNKLFFARNNLHIIKDFSAEYSALYVLANINSKLMNFFYQIINPEVGEALAEIKKGHVEQLPIKIISKDKEALQERLCGKVKQIINLKSSIDNAKTPQEKKNLERQIAALDKQIDQLVYELYDLTEDEIKIVEESVK